MAWWVDGSSAALASGSRRKTGMSGSFAFARVALGGFSSPSAYLLLEGIELHTSCFLPGKGVGAAARRGPLVL